MEGVDPFDDLGSTGDTEVAVRIIQGTLIFQGVPIQQQHCY